MRRVALVALLTVACGSVLQAQALTLAYAKGDQYHYAVHLTAKYSVNAGIMAIPQDVDLTASETATVQSVDSSGVADILLTFGNVNLKTTSSFGQTTITSTTTQLPFPNQELKIGPDGRVLSIDGTTLMQSTEIGLAGGGLLISAVLPDSAVKPGDHWSKDYDQANPSGGGSVHVATASQYLRDETVKGTKAAVVETKSTATLNLTINLGSLSIPNVVTPTAPSPSPSANQGSPLSGLGDMTVAGTIQTDVTTWIDPGSHRILQSHMTGTDDVTLSMAAAAGGTASAGPLGSIGPVGPISAKGSQTLNLDPA